MLSLKIVSLLFGAGSWIAVTGFWVELPVLITKLPEGWKLASYLTVMIQAANVTTLIYYFLRKWNLCSEVTAINIQMILGTISCVMLITHWDYTVYFWDQKRSLVLFIAAFGLSIVDCTSSVTFLPFMARFRECYLTPYLIGEGLSGFIATAVALLQGVDESEQQCSNELTNNSTLINVNNQKNNRNNITSQDTLRFSPEVFFSSLLATLLISWLAFIYMLYSRLAKREQLLNEHKEEEIKDEQSHDASSNLIDEKSDAEVESREECRVSEDVTELHAMKSMESKDTQSKHVSVTTRNENYTSSKQFWHLQALMCFCCLTTFGVMPPLQPYSSLPYGSTTLHFTVVFAGLSYPFGCFLAMVVKTRNTYLIYSLTAVGSLMAIYIFIASLMSPFPPLLQTSKQIGSILMVCTWILFTTILSYVKTVVTQIINDKGGNEGLFWVGMFTQIGSAIGAAFMFVSINYSNWFKDQCLQ